MKLLYLIALYCLIFSLDVQADMYKRIDPDGHVTYSSTPIKGGKKIVLDPLPVMVPLNSRTQGEGNSSFPRVDSVTQRGRDGTRRQILEDELATEQKALEEARRNLQEGEANPEVFKGANGQTFRNVAKYDEKVNALQEQVRLHEKNIDALNTELSNLK
jgi:hypothetical protein